MQRRRRSSILGIKLLNVPIGGGQCEEFLNQVFVEKYLEEALAHGRPARDTLGPRIENAMATLLPHGKAQASKIARRLGMSKQTSRAARLHRESLTLHFWCSSTCYVRLFAKRHLSKQEYLKNSKEFALR